MALTDDQRKFFDSLDTFTEQTFISTQYAGQVLNRLRKWKAEGRPVGTDDIFEWARQREHPDLQAGFLAGLVLAVKHDDDAEAQSQSPAPIIDIAPPPPGIGI